MTGKVTSTEVARRAGVSQSAVSRVFTPGASASPKTVEKVRANAEAAFEELEKLEEKKALEGTPPTPAPVPEPAEAKEEKAEEDK